MLFKLRKATFLSMDVHLTGKQSTLGSIAQAEDSCSKSSDRATQLEELPRLR